MWLVRPGYRSSSLPRFIGPVEDPVESRRTRAENTRVRAQQRALDPYAVAHRRTHPRVQLVAQPGEDVLRRGAKAPPGATTSEVSRFTAAANAAARVRQKSSVIAWALLSPAAAASCKASSGAILVSRDSASGDPG
jgi:hypothetical protein